MNDNKTALLKLFSAVLKERSKAEPQYQSISPEMVKYFSRKELIEIITHIYQDEDTPWETNLVEMENEELLLLIRDDYSIISYVTSKWSKEVSALPTFEEWKHSKIHPDIDKPTAENAELKLEENVSEVLNSPPKNEKAYENHDSDSENSDKPNSESPKSSEKKQEEKPSSKKTSTIKN